MEAATLSLRGRKVLNCFEMSQIVNLIPDEDEYVSDDEDFEETNENSDD